MSYGFKLYTGSTPSFIVVDENTVPAGNVIDVVEVTSGAVFDVDYSGPAYSQFSIIHGYPIAVLPVTPGVPNNTDYFASSYAGISRLSAKSLRITPGPKITGLKILIVGM